MNQSTGVPLGALGSAASVSVPLALLNPRQITAIDEAVHGGPVVVTPWRGLVLPGAARSLDALARLGLITDDASVWSRLTACIGSPCCAKSVIDTSQLSHGLVSALTKAPPLPTHLSGCSRRCGAPAEAHIDLVAPESLERALAEIERVR